MAQTGYTPVQLYRSSTAAATPSAGNLADGELALNTTDEKLYFKNSTGVVKMLASTANSVTIGTTNIALGQTSLTLAGLTSVTLTQDPTSNLQAATKQYVDALVAVGIHYHTPVKYEVPNTTGNLNATYKKGRSGVGATLTNAGNLGAFTPDGTGAQVSDRILIYNQANAFENGVYTVTTVGDGSTPWVLTRASDADTYGPGPTGLGEGSAFFITSGDTGAGETYVVNTSGTITFGTTPISFTQISATQVYSAGTGLTLTGTVFSLTAPVATSLGGTGATSYTDGQLLIGRTSDGSLVKAGLSAGTGISVTNGAGSISITNTAPDQTVTLTGAGTTVVTGSYPNFTITSNDQYVGTVTSVSGTGTVNGLTLTGTVTSSGSLTLGGTLSGVDLATAVTGTLPVANGGTGATSLAANAVLIGNGTSAITAVSPGTAGHVLTSTGTAWVSQVPSGGLSQAKATGLNFIFGL